MTPKSKEEDNRILAESSQFYNWKGDNAGYSAIHSWIRNHYGNANRCENPDCTERSKIYEWANISGEYHRRRSDFKMLCRSCHRLLDMNRTNRCRNGHEKTGDNIYIESHGSITCKKCFRAAQSKYGYKRRATLKHQSITNGENK